MIEHNNDDDLMLTEEAQAIIPAPILDEAIAADALELIEPNPGGGLYVSRAQLFAYVRAGNSSPAPASSASAGDGRRDAGETPERPALRLVRGTGVSGKARPPIRLEPGTLDNLAAPFDDDPTFITHEPETPRGAPSVWAWLTWLRLYAPGLYDVAHEYAIERHTFASIGARLGVAASTAKRRYKTAREMYEQRDQTPPASLPDGCLAITRQNDIGAKTLAQAVGVSVDTMSAWLEEADRADTERAVFGPPDREEDMSGQPDKPVPAPTPSDGRRARGEATRQRVVQAVRDLTAAHGHPPTQRALLAHLGMTSAGGLQRTVAALIADGRLGKGPGGQGLVVTAE